MLELKNICVSFRSERQDKVFGHTRQQVLFDVSLNVKRGTCLGILGESGSGKSTMGRVLCGLLKPDSGEAILDGVSVYASRALPRRSSGTTFRAAGGRLAPPSPLWAPHCRVLLPILAFATLKNSIRKPGEVVKGRGKFFPKKRQKGPGPVAGPPGLVL